MRPNFDRIDLNLLKALNALLEERSVTRSANRLFITQSAMSKALHRLRDLFQDPLLIRAGGGLVTTPLADTLVEPVREIAARIEACLAPATFEPATVKADIRIAAPEQFALVTMPSLLTRLRMKAPGILLDSQHLADDYLDLLTAGALDFALTREHLLPAEFRATRILTSGPKCWCRKGHPLSRKDGLTLNEILSYPLIVLQSQTSSQNFSTEVINEVRSDISAASLKTNVLFRTSQVMVGIHALLQFDGLMFAPNFMSRIPWAGTEIEAISIDHIAALNRLGTTAYLVQHRRTEESPLHRWMADEIRDLIAKEFDA